MTEAEQITLEMMAAYSTNPRFFLDKLEETKPAIFDPPRTETGTINETRRAQALLRSFNQNPPKLTARGGSGTYDLPIGTNMGIGGGKGGAVMFDSINPGYGGFSARQFPGGTQNAKYQGIGYRLGQHLGIRPYPSSFTSMPTDPIRSRLYSQKSGGAIIPENPQGYSYNTRTLINRGGNFQPFIEGRFGKSIPRMNVLGAASGGLNRLAAADPPVVRSGGTYRVPGQLLQGSSQSTYVTPTMKVVPGGGARDMGLQQLAMPGAQQSLRDNTPQKVARREQLRLQRSQGTDVDNRPSQGSDLDMKAIKREVKRAEIIVEFDKAFAKARRQGKQEFTWRGKRYNTQLK